MGEKIDPDLWSDDGEPRLIGGKLPSGEVVFPMPKGDAAANVEPHPLSRQGRLWSWTTQSFLPKEPYEGPGSGPSEGPEDFKPFLLGYVELPGEVIVESRLVEAELDELRLDLPVELCIVPFNKQYDTFAFRPTRQSQEQAA
ncbi:MAG: OB-fold domain-containing protein [Erythrobacter sp.]|uniref:Zn-ribbon domain-containing OB-fold protein n=1 Tax=Erythrobacter sp. TaxID=1042 RepID=UPI003C761E38